MIAQARLCIIANKIYNEFLATHIINATISEELAYKFEDELRDWRNSLPPYFIDMDTPTWFHGPRAVILWKEQNLRLMLWRGGQKSNRVRSRSEVATQNYIQVALESVRAICSFCMASGRLHQGLSWYAAYFLFQAVLVLDFGILQSPEDEQAGTWRSSIDAARRCFSELGGTNPAALRCISVLDRIHSHHQNLASNNHQVLDDAHSTSHQYLETENSIQLEGQRELIAEHQVYSADPALQLFLDGPPMTNLFDGVYGFPSTQEQENFDYVPGDFYNMEDFDMNFNWNDPQS
jgi:transcriptional regulatory protein GAL4